MTIYTLMNRYYEHNKNGHYFDHDTLKFFGERLSEMRVLKAIETITDISGEKHECYCVSSVQRPPFGRPHRHYTYFDTTTYEQIIR